MDPNATLKELRKLAEDAVERGSDVEELTVTDLTEGLEDAERMGELVEALDEWLQGGGFLPKRWQTKGER